MEEKRHGEETTFIMTQERVVFWNKDDATNQLRFCEQQSDHTTSFYWLLYYLLVDILIMQALSPSPLVMKAMTHCEFVHAIRPKK